MQLKSECLGGGEENVYGISIFSYFSITDTENDSSTQWSFEHLFTG